MLKSWQLRKILTLGLIFFLLVFFIYPQVAQAAVLTTISDTMSRVKVSQTSNHDMKFRTPTGMSSSTFTIDFNTGGFTSGSADYTDIDLQYGSSQAEVNNSCSSSCAKATLAAAAGSATWGAAFATNTLTFTYPSSGGTAMNANDYVRVLVGTNATYQTTGDQQITNPSGTGTKIITITLPSDSGKLAVAMVTNDQVVVSTTIDPYLTLTLTQTSVSLTKSGGGDPDYQNTGYNNGTANTLAASTNGPSGYTITYLGSTLSANGGANTIDAMAAKGASSTNTEQFGINLKVNTTPSTGADPSGGSGTPASDYNTANNFRYIADTITNLATASASTQTTTYTVTYITNVTQTTEAGAYSTTITYITTGNY